LSNRKGVSRCFAWCEAEANEDWNVPDELAREPEEGLLEVVVGLGRDLKVLEVLLAVERDGSNLDLALLSEAVADRARGRMSAFGLWPPTRPAQRGACGLRARGRTLTSTLLPQRTIGMFSQTRSRSRCQLGTFLYVMREVTSNMMMPHWPWM
jgi:hypothetical protein